MVMQLTAEGGEAIMNGLFRTSPPLSRLNDISTNGYNPRSIPIGGLMARAIAGTSELLSAPFAAPAPSAAATNSSSNWYVQTSSGITLISSTGSYATELRTTPAPAMVGGYAQYPASFTLDAFGLTVPHTFGATTYISTALRNEICNILVRGERETTPFLSGTFYLSFYNSNLSLTSIPGNNLPTLLGTAAVSETNFTFVGGTAQLNAPVTVTGSGSNSMPITHMVVARTAGTFEGQVPGAAAARVLVCTAGGLSGNVRVDVENSRDNGMTFNLVAFNLAFG